VRQPSGGEVFGDREADGQGNAADPLDLLERGGLALKNSLLRLRNCQAAQDGCDLTAHTSC
jgi:hypothetical protein